MTPAIDARDLFRVYADVEGAAAALQGLTLTVADGEVVVVFGPSGSGKTTFLRIVAALDRPSAGRVEAFGHDLRTLRGASLRAYRSRTLGYVDQHYDRALAPELTARELVALQPALLGSAREERLRRADELLERVGLGDRRDARARELSGGQRQRIALCAALAHRPKLLVADEPTGELDAVSARNAYALLGELARENGATTLIVSHDPGSASIADRIVHVRDGRVSAESTREGTDELVVGRGGWIRLPEELLRRTSIVERARARADGAAIVVEGTGAALAAEAASVPERAATQSVAAEIRGIVKRYADVDVFHGLDAAFAAGRLTAVTGPSGSGKSTLLHLLAGLDVPDAGEVFVGETRVDTLDTEARAALRRGPVALVTQGADLVQYLTARENVELALELRGTAGDADGALAAVGLADLAGQRVSKLSTGERQRVALARAIAARPALLLADEPTARLDEPNARAVGALFARLAAETGAAVVCATHDEALIDSAAVRFALG
jgi:ABC-type lipoprotein export system ATPase subunit